MRALHFVVPALLAAAAPLAAQEPEAAPDTVVDVTWMLRTSSRGGLTLASAKTYNRVEGLPIIAGPAWRGRIGSITLGVSALGILRSAAGFTWDAENLGHRISIEGRRGRRRGIAIGAVSFDDVAKIEPWQLEEPDGGLASFFLRRDYFDHFGRHGGRLYARAFRGSFASATVGYSHERWSSRRARDVFSLFRADETWRPNPQINDGTVHVADLALHLDSRNSRHRPLAGWFISASYELGSGDFAATQSPRGGNGDLPPPPPVMEHRDYGRFLLDVRRYNRVSQQRRLNGRLVLGGWLHGDELPLERRFSVGGIGTLPGFDFRDIGPGTDVGLCTPPAGPLPGRPAECERVVLAQAEYRHELRSELVDVLNRNGIRLRGADLRVRPEIVVFADAGRGWLVGPSEGTLQYSSGSFPSLGTFRTDLGVGLDLGILGVYLAKAASEPKEPANFFVRVRNRF